MLLGEELDTGLCAGIPRSYVYCEHAIILGGAEAIIALANKYGTLATGKNRLFIIHDGSCEKEVHDKDKGYTAKLSSLSIVVQFYLSDSLNLDDVGNLICL